MHQRVGFYVSKSGRLIALGNYGVALDKKDDPNDGNGIGRVAVSYTHLIPEEWTVPAAKKDYQLLFGEEKK